MLQTAAAGHLHADKGNALNPVVPYDLRQLFAVIYLIKLGTTHKNDLSLQELLMEISVSVSAAIRCN